ncbi:hypothetical protein PMIT1327_00478 [Prochlorococcus marinus str. MIT 1327]|nr:hypothetical protein PMIT1312_00922 [Prochlorococcus marinus str. MIT 1312]KZR83396.1 hypothetical protein PMIT1327_00478 [Prochlorococcus marinus str. MIT 1327]
MHAGKKQKHLFLKKHTNYLSSLDTSQTVIKQRHSNVSNQCNSGPYSNYRLSVNIQTNIEDSGDLKFKQRGLC